jgi:uncharacterized RDD family membrane protein YckC
VDDSTPSAEARFAEWYAWAKREIGTDDRVCLGAARAALEALQGGGDDTAARQAARRSVAGHSVALIGRIPPRHRAYAEWYDWARRESPGDRDRMHRMAHAALRRLEEGGDPDSAAAAARATAEQERPRPMPPAPPGPAASAPVPTAPPVPAPPVVATAGDEERDEAEPRTPGADGDEPGAVERAAGAAEPRAEWPRAEPAPPPEPPPAPPPGPVGQAAPVPAWSQPPPPPPYSPAYAAGPHAPPPYGVGLAPAPLAPPHAYGGFPRRLGACLVDTVLLSVGLAILTFVISIFSIVAMLNSGQQPTNEGIWGYLAVLTVIAFVLSWLYFAGLESSGWQATIGKRLTGLVVTDAGGRRIAFGRATGRFYSKMLLVLVGLVVAIVVALVLAPFVSDLNVVSLVALGLGVVVAAGVAGVLIAATRRRQALHDLMASTLVVRREHLSEVLVPAAAQPAASHPGGPGEVRGVSRA